MKCSCILTVLIGKIQLCLTVRVMHKILWHLKYNKLPSYRRTVVPSYRGTVVPWYRGTVVPSYRGTVVPWYRRTVSASRMTFMSGKPTQLNIGFHHFISENIWRLVQCNSAGFEVPINPTINTIGRRFILIHRIPQLV